MNTAVQAMIDDVKAFERGTDRVLLLVVRLRERDIIDMNTDDQLYEGKDGEGREISPSYAASTIKKKKRKGDPYDRVTLLDRGDFYDGWSIDYRDDEFFIASTDRKIGYLVQRYGTDIFGLTDQNIDRLIDMIREDFIKESRDKILTP